MMLKQLDLLALFEPHLNHVADVAERAADARDDAVSL
jgi:hypothetical protein